MRRLAVLALCSLALIIGLPKASATAGESATLRVMTFNIWVGGEQVDFDKVVEAIEVAGADIVGIQEAGGNLERLADELGWFHLEERGRHQQIISRYPLIRGPHPDVFVYALVDEAHAVAISNVHLTAYPYGPYELRDGATVEEALAMEERHLDELEQHFAVLPELAAEDVPVFFVGDLNVPSHLDWTEAAADASGEWFRTAIDWPVSVRLDELGFRDTFREVRPDEVATPGYTWTPGYPPPEMTDDEVHDRIDYVYAAGPSTTLDSAVVGDAKGPQVIVQSVVNSDPLCAPGAATSCRLTGTSFGASIPSFTCPLRMSRTVMRMWSSRRIASCRLRVKTSMGLLSAPGRRGGRAWRACRGGSLCEGHLGEAGLF
jgi:endonuclease/exonuclease/phosphatase family metal-dependent hydrolase